MLTHFRQRPPAFITAAFAFSVAVCYFAGTMNIGFVGRILILVCIAAGIVSVVLLHRKPVYLALVTVMLVCVVASVHIMKANAAREVYLQRYIGKNLNIEGMVYRCDNSDASHIAYIRADRVMGVSVKPFNMVIITDAEKNAPTLYDRAVYNVDVQRPDSGLYTHSQADIYRSRSVFIMGNGSFIAVKNTARGIYSLLKTAQDFLKSCIDRLFYSELFKALITGDRNDLSDYDRNLFAQAGISHVLALSGLHISMILAFFHKGFNILSAPRAVYHTGAVLVVLFYMAMTGFSYSVTRAGIMMFFLVLSVELYNRYDALNGLCTALFVILAFDPYAVGDMSFQLSFLATLGIIVMALPFIKKLEKKMNPAKLRQTPFFKRMAMNAVGMIAVSLTVTFSVTLFTLPVMIIGYGDAGLVAFLSNIVAVPMAGIIVTSLLFYIILSLIHSGAALLLGKAIDGFTEIFYKIVRLFAEIRIPEYTVVPELADIFGIVLLLALVIMVLFNSRSVYFFIPSLLAIALWTVTLGIGMRDGVNEVHYLNYADTQTVIFRKGNSVTVCNMRGNDASAVKDFCEEYNIGVIDRIVVSVPQEDYRRYFGAIIADGIEIKSVLHCPLYKDELIVNRYKKYFNSHAIEFECFEYGTAVNTQDISFKLTAQSFSDYVLEADFCGKRLYFSVNIFSNKLCPIYPEGDICVLYGRGWYIPDTHRIDSRIIMAQEMMHQRISGARNLYKIPYAAGCIFNWSGEKISMRSIG
ncbi:MAG: ComEC/Rec2 family competence protein [Ruminococcaceae bacterium]|nr:ComEC/Rec2 family competence protein [Oscillospiraceae bacterium]